MKVLVTGASGFFGRHICYALAQEGHDVIGLVRRVPDTPLCKGVGLAIADLTSSQIQLPIVDAIVHLAQSSALLPLNSVEFYEVNTTSTLKLLEHARTTGAKNFVFTSTGNVYGSGSKLFIESDTLNPSGLYSVSKANAEALVQCYKDFMNIAIVRPFTPYGPNQNNRLVPSIVHRIINKIPVNLFNGGEPLLTPVYIGDAVKVINKLCTSEGDWLLNLAGEESLNIRMIADKIGAITNISPVYDEVKTGIAGGMMGCCKAMKEFLNVEKLTSFDEGIEVCLSKVNLR